MLQHVSSSSFLTFFSDDANLTELWPSASGLICQPANQPTSQTASSATQPTKPVSCQDTLPSPPVGLSFLWPASRQPSQDLLHLLLLPFPLPHHLSRGAPTPYQWHTLHVLIRCCCSHCGVPGSLCLVTRGATELSMTIEDFPWQTMFA